PLAASPSFPSKPRAPRPISAARAAQFPNSILPARNSRPPPAPLRILFGRPQTAAVPCTPRRGCFALPPLRYRRWLSPPAAFSPHPFYSPQSSARPPNTPAPLQPQPESHRHGKASSPCSHFPVCLEFALRPTFFRTLDCVTPAAVQFEFLDRDTIG